MLSVKIAEITMIDRLARRRAAQLFRGFLSGKVTNFAFEAQCPQTDDRAIHAIWDTAWLLYDDFKTHSLVGRHGLSRNERKACIRWMVFLHSDFEYDWPELQLPGSDPALRVRGSGLRWLFGSSGFDLSIEEANKFLAAGHYAVWPFISVRDYKQALRNPRLLGGSPST